MDDQHALHPQSDAPYALDGAAQTSSPAVRLRHLSRSFGARAVIDEMDLEIGAGEFVALLGPSGCGKSTLLRILADLDRDFDGEVEVPTRAAVAFQAPRLMPWKSVWRNVALGLKDRDGAKSRSVQALAEVGLSHRADVWPKVLSGGEAQRVALARALVRDPELLLLDEPFAALDALTRLKAQAMVADLWQRHRCAVLLVTHDVDEAILLADRVLVMKNGVIAHQTRITAPRPRAMTQGDMLALRQELLGYLGVH